MEIAIVGNRRPDTIRAVTAAGRRGLAWMAGIAVWGVLLVASFFSDAWVYRNVAHPISATTGLDPWMFRDIEQASWHTIVGRALRDARASNLHDLLRLFKQMGHFFFAIVVLITMVVLNRRRLRQAAILLLCIAVAGSSASAIKPAVSKQRPNANLTAAEAKELIARDGPGAVTRIQYYPREKGVSYHNRGSAVFREPFVRGERCFPSGHTTLVFAMYAGLACCFPSGRHWFLLLACCVGISRVLVGAHFVSDVVAGAGLGYAVARGLLAMPALREAVALPPAAATS